MTQQPLNTPPSGHKLRNERTHIAGVPFTPADPATAVEMTLELLKSDKTMGADIHLLNAYSVALAETDSDYQACVSQATFNFPDGKPVAASGTIFGGKLHQVRGPAFFEDVISAGRGQGVRHYLLGSTPNTLEALEAALGEKYPGVQIVGMMSPPFRTLSAEEQAVQDQEIRSARPDIVWVGLGTPKQDHEARRLATEGFVAAAVGAAFDFSAGLKPLAPKIVRDFGLEWLHRLVSEPRRLMRRYLWGNTTFLIVVAKQLMQR